MGRGAKGSGSFSVVFHLSKICWSIVEIGLRFRGSFQSPREDTQQSISSAGSRRSLCARAERWSLAVTWESLMKMNTLPGGAVPVMTFSLGDLLSCRGRGLIALCPPYSCVPVTHALAPSHFFTVVWMQIPTADALRVTVTNRCCWYAYGQVKANVLCLSLCVCDERASCPLSIPALSSFLLVCSRSVSLILSFSLSVWHKMRS